MRKLFVLLTMIILLTTGEACAAGLETQMTFNNYNLGALDSSLGLRVYGGDRFRVWGSYESTMLRYGGQETADIDLFGIGIGYEDKWKSFSYHIDLGYYEPQTSIRGGAAEGINIEMSRMLYPRYPSIDYLRYSYPEYDLHGNFGGSIGMAFNHQISKCLDVHLGIDYRLLSLQEAMTLRHNNVSWLETFRERDFGGYLFTLGVSWKL